MKLTALKVSGVKLTMLRMKLKATAMERLTATQAQGYYADQTNIMDV